jgi:acyl carrier protein
MITKIFISYGREDAEAAKSIYDELKDAGLDPWLDTESLVPGQQWKSTIRKAIRESRYFLALLSHRSVSRKGFINKELAEALEVLEEYPESEIFLIPVRLDDCRPSHEKLSELHRVDMFPSWDKGMRQIRKAIKLDTPKINVAVGVEEPSYSAEQRKEIIIRVIADELGVDVSDIDPDTSLEDLGGDGLDAIEIKIRLGNEFEIEISDEDAEEYQIVKDVLTGRNLL